MVTEPDLGFCEKERRLHVMTDFVLKNTFFETKYVCVYCGKRGKVYNGGK